MSAKLKEIAEKYLKKVIVIETNEDGMLRWRELRSKGDWAEEEDFIINLVQATRFLK